MNDVGSPEDYYKDGVQRIYDLCREAFGSKFVAYFNGDPEEIAEADLPAITVSEPDGVIESGATQTDDIVEVILIKLIHNKKDDVNADNKNVNLTEWKQRQLVKGQDPTTKQYMEGTLMHALRTKFTLGDATVNQRVELLSTSARRGENTFTQEYWITVTIERRAIVPART